MPELFQASGRLLYRRLSSGQVRGREDWILTRNRDGSRTLRATASTDDSLFLRDAVVTVDPRGRPLDAFCRLMVKERWAGSGYLRADGSRLRVTADLAETGTANQEVEVPERFHIMSHAVMHDGWTFWSYDGERGGPQDLTVYNTSTRWDGTDGPLGSLQTLRAEALGKETVKVPAGTFETFAYRLVSEAIGSPECRLWVTLPDLLLVRYEWADLDLEYVLATLESLGGDREWRNDEPESAARGS